MDSHRFEFGIALPVTHSDQGVVIRGRNHEGAIQLGAMFTRARTLEFRGPLTGELVRVWSNERKVCLRVERITAYGHDLQELSPGMTAQLELTGSGGTSLSKNDVLDG